MTRLTGRRLTAQRVMLVGIGALSLLGIAGYFASSPSAHDVNVLRCRPESHPVYLVASATVVALVVVALVKSKGRPAAIWLDCVAILQLCTAFIVAFVSGMCDALSFARACSYYRPVDGLGGACVLLAGLFALVGLFSSHVLFWLEERRPGEAIRETVAK